LIQRRRRRIERAMNNFVQRVMITFGTAFALSVVAILIYFFVWQKPEQRCEMGGNWWDPSDRICAKPIFLPTLTHRPIGAPKLKPGEPVMIPPPKGVRP
jgi:hypothetical protein